LFLLFLYVYGQSVSPSRTQYGSSNISSTPSTSKTKSTPVYSSSVTPIVSNSNTRSTTPVPSSSPTPFPSSSKTRSTSPSPSGNKNTGYVIDDFYIQSSVEILPSYYSYFPISDFEYVTGSTSQIIGGERDLTMIAYTGQPNSGFSTTISFGATNILSPYGGYGKTVIQWDGYDGSMNLNPSGLGSINFAPGTNSGFQFEYFSEESTNITMNVYSGSNSSFCTYTEYNTVSYAYIDTIYYFQNFASVGSGCSFNNVGAIELIINLPSETEITIGGISLYSDQPNSSPSQTPSSSPTPSRSKPLQVNQIDNFHIDMKMVLFLLFCN